jgi:hypothetical protein
MRNLSRWFCWAIATLPAIGPLLLIDKYGVDFHYWDEWDSGFAGLFVKIHNHQATIADLFAQNNEHRQVIPRLLLLLTNPLTHWNNFAVLLMGWACACTTSLSVLSMIRRSVTANARIPVIWFLCNLLIFSPLQYEIWLWGIGLDQWMLTAILCLSFLAAISRIPLWPKLALCTLLAAAANYSFGNGLLAWPLIGLLLLWSVAGDLTTAKKWVVACAWAAGCLVCVGFYFHRYVQPPHWGSYSNHVGFLNVIFYNFVFMGSPFAHSINHSVTLECAVVGASMFAMLLVLAAYFIRAWRGDRRELSNRMFVWFIVAGYAVLSGLVASLSRAGYGAEQATSSRYIAYAVYLPLALVVLLPIVAADQRSISPNRYRHFWNYTPVALAFALVLLQGLALPKVLDACWAMRLTQRQGKAALLLAYVLPDNPAIPDLVGAQRFVFQDANALNEMGYFHPPLIHDSDARQLEAEDNGKNAPIIGRLEACVADASGHIDVRGWAVNRSTLQLTDGVFLAYQDPSGRQILFAPARMNALRRDILQQYRSSTYEWSGWQASFLPSQIPAEIKDTKISAWVLDADTGRAYLLRGLCTFRR